MKKTASVAVKARETSAKASATKPASKQILVYADWEPGAVPFKLGTLTSHPANGQEVFEFAFTKEALAHPDLRAYPLDPGLSLFEGPQYCAPGRPNFGVFLDAAPDRWGRVLMRRRLERDKRKGLVPENKQLVESDYLLGVHDTYRAGALRFRLQEDGPFLDDNHGQAAPPMVQLRALEQASRALEAEDQDDAQVDEWLKMLLAPGGSLGGARPKASAVDPQGNLWIAKFPSVKDEVDIGAWELVVHTLARGCGIRVPQAEVRKFSGAHHTFLVRRFDRTPEGFRLYFASAMTLTGHQDGEDASTGVSYLELAEVLVNHGADTKADLKELWTRIVFNMFVSNTDDHLRNHGFILLPGRGWKLSDAYDMNPVAHAGGLKLNVSEHDNAREVDLALSVAPVFRIGADEAAAIVEKVRSIASRWRLLAEKVGIPRAEQDRMASAFALATP